MRIKCGECRGDGIAEYIDHMARPCDACHGEGELSVPFFWAIIINVSDWFEKARRAA